MQFHACDTVLAQEEGIQKNCIIFQFSITYTNNNTTYRNLGLDCSLPGNIAPFLKSFCLAHTL